MNVLKEKYQKEVVPALMKDFDMNNKMQVPTLVKMVVNIGMGEALDDTKTLDAAMADLASITGQKPVITKAKKSIANFKLREGQAIGLYHAFVTSAVFRKNHSTAVVITPWDYASN